jgi:hypothetical protein
MLWKAIKVLRILFVAIVSTYLATQIPPYIDTVDSFLQNRVLNKSLFLIGILAGIIAFFVLLLIPALAAAQLKETESSETITNAEKFFLK